MISVSSKHTYVFSLFLKYHAGLKKKKEGKKEKRKKKLIKDSKVLFRFWVENNTQNLRALHKSISVKMLHITSYSKQ